MRDILSNIVLRLLKRVVARRPRRVIHGKGSLYLERWYLLGRPLPWVPPEAVRLRWLPSMWVHHFHRPDADRELHNHPWAWAASLIVGGSYDEDRQVAATPPTVRRRRVRFVNFISRKTLHRVATLHGDVWTIFTVGRKVGSWGFLRDGVVVPWRQFLRERGEAPLDA